PEKQTELNKQEISFLESAHREEFQAYNSGAGDFGAPANERGGEIVLRGRGPWELVLGVLDTKVASAFVDDFGCAGEAVLGWLRGAGAADILSPVGRHLLLMCGAVHSFVLDRGPRSRI